MKKMTIVWALLMIMLLPMQHVQAASQKSIILTSENNKVDITLQLPSTVEKVTTLSLRMRLEGDVDQLDTKGPITLQLDSAIKADYIDTRYDSTNHTYTIYLSDPTMIIDKNDFHLGTIELHTNTDATQSFTITIAEDGLSYVDGNENLDQEAMTASLSTQLVVNAPQKQPDTENDTVAEENQGADSPLSPQQDPSVGETPTNGQEQVSTDVETGTARYLLSYAIIGIIASFAIVLAIRQKKQR